MKRIDYNPENNKHDVIDYNNDYYDINNQLNYLLLFESGQIADCSLNKIIKKEISKKISSYKSQDKKNSKYDEEQHISYLQLLSKLKKCNLKCYYCNEKLFLLYKKRGEPMQWSLERFDNNIGHYETNTCISCLKCNLQRRTSNHEYFKFSKNLTISKV
uniref:Uncharacterized protein n=1 Tax=viral metagenome TaxID=1070528 RepID=A0A6C0L043_9ZZZZ|tara:strand:+ start:1639 stop:2115 length:477 start_codon:yes stop_codon:yes gene_type:complete